MLTMYFHKFGEFVILYLTVLSSCCCCCNHSFQQHRFPGAEATFSRLKTAFPFLTRYLVNVCTDSATLNKFTTLYMGQVKTELELRGEIDDTLKIG